MSGYLVLPGTNGNFASASYTWPTADTGTMTIIVRAAASDWTPSDLAAITGSTNSFNTLLIDTAGKSRQWIYDTATRQGISTTAVPFANGTTGWLKSEVDFDANTCDFSTSTSDTNDFTSVSWSPLGTQIAYTTTTRIAASVIAVGNANHVGTLYPWAGNIYGVVVQFNGSSVFDADFTDLTPAEITAKAFVEDSANGATVTLNGAAWTYTVVVPNLVGRTVAQAQALIEPQLVLAGGTSGVITEQTPVAGSLVSAGDTVTVTAGDPQRIGGVGAVRRGGGWPR